MACVHSKVHCDPDPPISVSKKTILVLGIGNLMLGDEGVGIHAIRALKEMKVPENVEVVDGGTGGFELLMYFRGKKKVIIIDAMNGDAEPGMVFRCLPNDLDLKWRHPYSSHQSTITELLYFATLESPSLEIVLFGIVPEIIHEASTELSRVIQDRIPQLISAVWREIHS